MGDSRIIIPVFFGIILLTSFSASQSAFAHGTVDQSCEKVTGANSSIGFGEPQGQTFVPTADNIVGVDFLISSARDEGDVILTIRDGINGSILGTDTQIVPSKFSGSIWIHFDFDSIPLTPGNTYVLQLNEPDFATTSTGGTNFLVDFTQLEDCTGDRFHRGVIIISDLIHRTYSLSINPQNSPPTVSITSPSPGSEFDEGNSVTFQGSASDSEDGNLSSQIQWSSSIDNAIGSGASFSANLSVGTHIITATITDSGGLSDSDAITITVNPQNSPSDITSYSDFASFDSATGSLTFIDFEDQIIECNYFEFDPFPFNPCSPSPHSIGEITITDPTGKVYFPFCGNCGDALLFLPSPGTIEFSAGTAAVMLVIEGMGNQAFTIEVTDGTGTETFNGNGMIGFGNKVFLGFTSPSGIQQIKVIGVPPVNAVLISELYHGIAFSTNSLPTADAGGPYLVAVEQSTSFDGTGSDDPDGDSLTYLWTADGGALDDATLSTPLYTAGLVAGIYDVSLTVSDPNVSSLPATTMVVVYDPEGGFVTGGGWIDSPIGACTFEDCIDATVGKATFGFVSKYQKGATVPSGNTQFHFKAGNLKFKSSDYEWLTIVIAGAKAQFKGTGTINGEGDYGFMITALDADLNDNDSHTEDKFRIKIWDKNNADTVVYDNKMGAADDSDDATIIGGGSIKIHKP